MKIIDGKKRRDYTELLLSALPRRRSGIPFYRRAFIIVLTILAWFALMLWAAPSWQTIALFPWGLTYWFWPSSNSAWIGAGFYFIAVLIMLSIRKARNFYGSYFIFVVVLLLNILGYYPLVAHLAR